MNLPRETALEAAPTVGAGLADRVVICTGATGGIGRAVVDLLARCGARVFAVDIDNSALDRLVQHLPGQGHGSLAVDLTDAALAESVAVMTEEQVGPVYALICAAGVLRRQSIDTVAAAEWDWHMAINLRATFFAARGFCRVLRDAARPGSVTTFASQAWWTGGHRDAAAYAASKGGVVSVSRALANSYGPHGIRVNTIAPGAIDTPMLRKGLTDGAAQDLAGATPLRRLGQPDEVAAAAVFLASDNARFITGTVLNVSGGWLAY